MLVRTVRSIRSVTVAQRQLAATKVPRELHPLGFGRLTVLVRRAERASLRQMPLVMADDFILITSELCLARS